MKGWRILWVVLIALFLYQQVDAYVASGCKKWSLSDLPIPYEINQNGSDNCNGEEFDAVRSGFSSWTQIATCSLNFKGGELTPYMPSTDGYNTIAWKETDWLSLRNIDPSIKSTDIAITAYVWDILWGTDTVLKECDVFLNGEYCSWSTNQSYGTYDIENTIAHEAGHWLGLSDDVSNPEVTMYYEAFPREILKRTLHPDDIAGASYLYPYVPTWPFEGQAVYCDDYHHFSSDVAMVWNPTGKNDSMILTTYVSCLYLTIYSTNIKPTRRT